MFLFLLLFFSFYFETSKSAKLIYLSWTSLIVPMNFTLASMKNCSSYSSSPLTVLTHSKCISICWSCQKVSPSLSLACSVRSISWACLKLISCNSTICFFLQTTAHHTSVLDSDSISVSLSFSFSAKVVVDAVSVAKLQVILSILQLISYINHLWSVTFMVAISFQSERVPNTIRFECAAQQPLFLLLAHFLFECSVSS